MPPIPRPSSWRFTSASASAPKFGFTRTKPTSRSGNAAAASRTTALART